MKKGIETIFIIFISFFFVSSIRTQDNLAYLKTNAIRINNPEKLSDSVYTLLSRFQIILFGETHGTNESTPFVNGLANLFSEHGDTVLVGLEIPERQMSKFLVSHTDKSIFESDFFTHPPYESGKESIPWATLISNLNKNPSVHLFFYEMDNLITNAERRDSLMYANIKSQIKSHPTWRVITHGGNYHNKISDLSTMAGFLNTDKELNISSKMCSLNLEYLEGSCKANFGHGLEVKLLGHPDSIFDTAISFKKYIVLVSPKSNYEYTGFYYTKYITAAKMVAEN